MSSPYMSVPFVCRFYVQVFYQLLAFERGDSPAAYLHRRCFQIRRTHIGISCFTVPFCVLFCLLLSPSIPLSLSVASSVMLSAVLLPLPSISRLQCLCLLLIHLSLFCLLWLLIARLFLDLLLSPAAFFMGVS